MPTEWPWLTSYPAAVPWETIFPPERVDRFLAYARSELGSQVAIYLQPQHWLSADLGEV